MVRHNFSGFMFYDIIKKDRIDDIIITQGFLLRLFKGPFPAFLYVVFGIILGLIASKDKLKVWKGEK